MNDDGATLLFVSLYALAGLIYIVPSIVAFVRHHPNRWLILAINLAFGATLIGWFGSLIWALKAIHMGDGRGGESGLNIVQNDTFRVRVEPQLQSPNGASNQVAELEKLAALRSAGALTDDEFSSAKRQVLGR